MPDFNRTRALRCVTLLMHGKANMIGIAPVGRLYLE